MLDTSVVIDWHDPNVVRALPDEMAISAITAAELAAGPLLASTAGEAAKRQVRLQEVESSWIRSRSTERQRGVTVSSWPQSSATDALRGVDSRTFSLPPQLMRTDLTSIPATEITSGEQIIWSMSYRSAEIQLT